MRLSTVAGDGATRLYVEGPDGTYVDVRDAAGEPPILDGVVDVGSLYRAGPPAVDAVRKHAAQATGAATHRLEELTLAPPVIAPRSIVCIGRNYMAHVEEGDAPVPEFPILFSKFPNTLVGHDAPVVHHRITQELDYEGELALVIGRRASRVAVDEAMEYVGGFTVANDISARDLQLGDLQWIRGKSLDTFCPLGPAVVSTDEIADVGALRIQTTVNGELRQDAPVSDMIFPIPELLAFITEAITLEPGDIVATGTPSGVAYGMSPRVYLHPGDVVEVTISDIGTLRSTIREPD